MTRTFSIFIRPDGSVEMIYSDHLHGLATGRSYIQRATHIEFNVERQRWEARCAQTGELIADDPLHSVCVAEELKWLENKLRQGSLCVVKN